MPSSQHYTHPHPKIHSHTYTHACTWVDTRRRHSISNGNGRTHARDSSGVHAADHIPNQKMGDWERMVPSLNITSLPARTSSQRLDANEKDAWGSVALHLTSTHGRHNKAGAEDSVGHRAAQRQEPKSPRQEGRNSHDQGLVRAEHAHASSASGHPNTLHKDSEVPAARARLDHAADSNENERAHEQGKQGSAERGTLDTGCARGALHVPNDVPLASDALIAACGLTQFKVLYRVMTVVCMHVLL